MILEDFGDRVLKVKNKFSELTREDVESIYREAWASRCSKPDYSYAYEHVGVIAKQLMISIPLAFQIAGEAFNKLAATREQYRKDLAGVAEETAREYAARFFPSYSDDDELEEPRLKFSESLSQEKLTELAKIANEIPRDEFIAIYREAWSAYCRERECGGAYDLLAESGNFKRSLQSHAIMSVAFDAIEALEDEFYAELEEQSGKVAERLAASLYQTDKKNRKGEP